jgi:hypothetical protein
VLRAPVVRKADRDTRSVRFAHYAQTNAPSQRFVARWRARPYAPRASRRLRRAPPPTRTHLLHHRARRRTACRGGAQPASRLVRGGLRIRRQKKARRFTPGLRVACPACRAGGRAAGVPGRERICGDEQRRARGGARSALPTSDSPRLPERSERSERSELRGAPPERAAQCSRCAASTAAVERTAGYRLPRRSGRKQRTAVRHPAE